MFKFVFVCTLGWIAAWGSAQAQILSCKSQGSWKNPSTYRARFKVKINERAAHAPYPLIRHRAEISGRQEGQPLKFEYTNARLDFSHSEITVASIYKSSTYESSFHAIIDRNTLKGRFMAKDSSLGGNGLNADAKSNSAVLIVCQQKAAPPTISSQFGSH